MTDEEALKEIDRQEKRFAAVERGSGTNDTSSLGTSGKAIGAKYEV